MNVLYLWDSEYPWDIRVEKTCDAIMKNGSEVHLIARNRLRSPLEEVYKNIRIHRIRFLSKRFGKINNIFTFPFFFSPVWLLRLNQVTSDFPINVIIVRDLPMAPAAILIGKLKNIPVILDMAECYPELIRLKWKFEPLKIQNVIIRNPLLADIVEKVVLRYVDHIFVMIEESKSRLINKSVPGDKITIVSNTPIIERFRDIQASYPGDMKKNIDKLKLLYVGLLNHSRGVDLVLRTMAKYIRQDTNIFLIVLGTGNAKEYLTGLTHDLGLTDYVKFEGWVDNKKVPDYIASADICLVPHRKCSHWDNTIPNKLFDYMAARKPVIVSNAVPIKRIVQETNCGMVYTDGDIDSFLQALEKLKDSVVRGELGSNGEKAVKEFYNWGNDSNAMLNAISEVVKSDG